MIGNDGEGTPTASVEEEPLGGRWIELFAVDAAPETEPELFDDAIAEAKTLLEARPDARPETIFLLEQIFGRGLARTTWADMTEKLSAYAGIGPAYLLNWLVYENTSERLEALALRADPAVVAYMRSIIARFYEEMNAAQIAIGVSPNDWAKIDKHVYFDTLTNSYLCSVTLTKLNGEVVLVEASADSLLNLATHLLTMVAAVGSAADFSPARVATFLESLAPLQTMFGPEPAPAGDGAAAGEA